MKWLFVLLLLANLALALWGQFGQETQPNPLARQEIHPESIKIVPPLQPPSSPLPASAPLPSSAPLAVKAPTPVKAPVLSCYRWGIFATAEAAAAKQAVAAVAPDAKVFENILKKPEVEGYWTYIPPEKSRDAALNEIRKLNKMGVKDHFLIQQSGKWQYAISLGIFKTSEAARKYAAMLRKKGVESAASGSRDGGQSELLIDSLADSAASEIGQFDFPGAQLEKADCKTFRGKASRD